MRGPPADRSLIELLSFGVVNLDKAPGPSAHQVAGWIRDAAADTAGALADDRPGDDRGGDDVGETVVDRAAHAGTLDPKVTGCLPVMLGDATRLAPVFLEGQKEYVAALELHGPPPTDLDAILAEFEGEIYQKPPRKSAVSRRLRTRTIHNLDVLDRQGRQVLLRIGCASGTYVRKLCHDLGLAAGTGGHMGDLRRTATDPFDDRDLVTMDAFVDALAFAREGDPSWLREVLDPAERALTDLPALTIAESAASEVAHGAPVYAPGVLEADETAGADDLVACFTPDGAAVCLGRLVGDPTADEGEAVDLARVLV